MAFQFFAGTDGSLAYFVLDLILAASMKCDLRFREKNRHDCGVNRLSVQISRRGMTLAASGGGVPFPRSTFAPHGLVENAQGRPLTLLPRDGGR